MKKRVLIPIVLLAVICVGVQPVMATHVYHWNLTMENFQVQQNSTSTSSIDISWDELLHYSKHAPTDLKYYKIAVYTTNPFKWVFGENIQGNQVTVETNQNNTNFNIYAWPVFTDSLMGKRQLVNFNTTGL